MTPDLLPDAEALIDALARSLGEAIHPHAVMVGVRTGGAWVAERLHRALGLEEALGTLDISFYRDDFSRIGLHPAVEPSHIPFDVDGREVVLVDDVLYTGRTVRAAMNELFDYGRPARIRLAVLVDRGGRELPVCPDHAALTLSLAANQHVRLNQAEAGRLSLSLHGIAPTED